jgi:protein Mpv17
MRMKADDWKFSPVGSKASYDPERTLRFAVFGAAMGPFIGRWLRLLERHIPMIKGAVGGSSTSTGIQLAKRVLADQVVM